MGDLGDRMKEYEAVTRGVLPRHTNTVIRVDGRAFHSLLRKAKRPFDVRFMQVMDIVAARLCKEIAGAVFAYVQSDEVSVLVQDMGPRTEPWFGGIVQKMVSISACAASNTFNEYRAVVNGAGEWAQFDSRVFTIPQDVEAANYFLWRQQDAVRNSVSMAAQAHFSHRQLQGVNSNQMQEMLFGVGVNWNDYPAGIKRGRICLKVPSEKEVPIGKPGEAVMTVIPVLAWAVQDAPTFVAQPGNWLMDAITAYQQREEA